MVKFLSLSLLVILMASCGSPRSTVRVINKAEGVQTTVHASTGDGGSTTVTVQPKVEIDSTKIL